MAKIIKLSDNLTKKDVYKLTHTSTVPLASLVEEDKSLQVWRWVILETVNEDGETGCRLILQDSDGTTYGTGSRVFINQFTELAETFSGEEIPEFKPVKRRAAKTGRTFIAIEVL